MKQVFAFVTLSALLAVSSATVRCDNYLNNSTYREAIGRWVAVYTWPARTSSGIYSTEYEYGMKFHAPTPEEIISHRSTTPNARIDTLTENPKLVVKHIFTGVEALLDFSGDEITRVKGYYNANDYLKTNQFKLRKIGDLLVMDFCENGKDGCVSGSAFMLRRKRSPERAAVAEAAACVVVPGTSGQEVVYRTE